MQFADAQPFPHLVIDEFLPLAEAEAAAKELEATSLRSWRRADHAEQVNKFWQPDPMHLPRHAARIVGDLDHPTFCDDLSDMLGIAGLQPDPTHEGGGVHVHTTGGSLGVHADFNQHPATGLHRRLNLLLYLNRDWDPAWGGQLELWSKERCIHEWEGTNPVCVRCEGLGWLPKACEQAIDPVFNRAVILATTDYGFHGVTPVVCPANRRRISIAAYYYTATRPDGEASTEFHWSTWPAKG